MAVPIDLSSSTIDRADRRVCAPQTDSHRVSDVGLRLDNGEWRMVRPRRGAVHLLLLDRRPCWRCGVIAAHLTGHVDESVAA